MWLKGPKRLYGRFWYSSCWWTQIQMECFVSSLLFLLSASISEKQISAQKVALSACRMPTEPCPLDLRPRFQKAWSEREAFELPLPHFAIATGQSKRRLQCSKKISTCNSKNRIVSSGRWAERLQKGSRSARCGARTHDHKVKSLALCQLS